MGVVFDLESWRRLDAGRRAELLDWMKREPEEAERDWLRQTEWRQAMRSTGSTKLKI
jgi:hypothetical protein